MSNTKFTELMNSLVNDIGDVAQKQFQAMIRERNPDPNRSWAQLKRLRKEFGPGIYCPVLNFTTKDEIFAFVESGEFPSQDQGQFFTAFVDEGESLDQLLNHLQCSQQRSDLKPVVDEMMEKARQKPHHCQPLLVGICLQPIKDAGDASLFAFSPRELTWWDTEAETVPYPDLTYEQVRSELSSLPSKFLLIDCSNPWHAGPNINLWLRAAEELGFSAVIDAETREAVRDLSPEYRSRVLMLNQEEAA